MGCTHSTTASSSAETRTSEVDVEIATDRRTAFGPGRRFLDLSRSMWGSAAAGGQTAAAHHDTSESELTIAHFVPIADLEAHGTFPRCGSDPTYVHAATGLGNANLHDRVRQRVRAAPAIVHGGLVGCSDDVVFVVFDCATTVGCGLPHADVRFRCATT